MKLFVTDYDDTLYKSDLSIKENVKKMNTLKKSDFLIMISTGRSYPSIKEQINKHNIYFDYLSCADGSIIYDNKENIIYKSILNIKIVNDFKNYYQNLDYDEIQFSYPKGYLNYIDKNDDLLGINVCLKNDKINEKIVNGFYKLKNNYTDYNYLFYKHPNFSYLCIKPSNVSKSFAINTLINKLNIKKNDVYIIGDSENDLEMIKDFNGVGMTNSCEKVLKIVSKTYNEVSEYIDEIKGK